MRTACDPPSATLAATSNTSSVIWRGLRSPRWAADVLGKNFPCGRSVSFFGKWRVAGLKPRPCVIEDANQNLHFLGVKDAVGKSLDKIVHRDPPRSGAQSRGAQFFRKILPRGHVAARARKHCANYFTGLGRFKLHKGEGRALRECGRAATSPPWPMLWAHRRAWSATNAPSFLSHDLLDRFAQFTTLKRLAQQATATGLDRLLSHRLA